MRIIIVHDVAARSMGLLLTFFLFGNKSMYVAFESHFFALQAGSKRTKNGHDPTKGIWSCRSTGSWFYHVSVLSRCYLGNLLLNTNRVLLIVKDMLL
jgi:hypothetical protein